MIELDELTKKYGDTTAVDAITATVRPGAVTGFLGPNGAGKSTTMPLIPGLDKPTSGTAHVNGKPYSASTAPLAEVGAVLDAKAVDGGRTARNHLLSLAASVGVGSHRVDEVLDLVGVTPIDRRHEADDTPVALRQDRAALERRLAAPFQELGVRFEQRTIVHVRPRRPLEHVAQRRNCACMGQSENEHCTNLRIQPV